MNWLTTLWAVLAGLLGGLALALLVSVGLRQSYQNHQKAALLGRIHASPTTEAASQLSAQEAASHPSGLDRLLERWPLLRRLAQQRQAERQLQMDNELVVLLEITALGMRAGLSFDQAFELAIQRWSGCLATLCQTKLMVWQRGLITREQGLRELEQQVRTTLFSRFVATVLRSLHYGAPMAQLLTALAEESRRNIRFRREEIVAKTPVRMLIPTAVLILPAMLLLVLGPIMLDLMGNL
ncbi:MAG: type II secretion system F family protein [Actinomycetia bacterium]|nr:type II secretion system F family protein [Actinomycetes bacterium]